MAFRLATGGFATVFGSGPRALIKRLALIPLLGSASLVLAQENKQAMSSQVQVPSFTLPYSSLASREAEELFTRQRDQPPPPPNASVAQLRDYYDAINADRVRRLRALFPVDIQSATIGGVRVDRVVPHGGVTPDNRHRVLINLHGGAFMWGAGNGALVEAIPIAAESGLEVLTVDYRQGPESHFPAASQDVESVYRALLKTHAPAAIGIYGCSAGGFLTAQAVAWFQTKRLPAPGAIGTFCGSLVNANGDSAYLATVANGQPLQAGFTLSSLPYFATARADDPLVFPGLDRNMLKAFPPTLLITGTRDFAMSSVIHSNELLTAAGVRTELHVWEGMGHAFFSDPEPEESRQAYRIIARFFRRELAADVATASKSRAP